MTAILVPAATEAEWLTARRKGITASEIAVVMGLSPYSSPFALYHRKTGTLPGEPDSDAMALGRYLEAFVCDRFAALHLEFYVHGDGRQLYAHPDRPWQMATPDRLITEQYRPQAGREIAVLEAKTDNSYDGWGDDGSDEIPVHYRCQVLWQMDVLGVTAGYLACLFLHSRKLRVYELTMDPAAEADLKIMRDTAQCFLDDIRDGRAPEPDWRPATSDMLKRLHPSVEDRDVIIPRRLAAQYRAACAAVKTAEQRKHLAENLIRERLGSARRAVENRVVFHQAVARRDVYDLPEKTITRKASTIDRLVAVNPKDTPS